LFHSLIEYFLRKSLYKKYKRGINFTDSIDTILISTSVILAGVGIAIPVLLPLQITAAICGSVGVCIKLSSIIFFLSSSFNMVFKDFVSFFNRIFSFKLLYFSTSSKINLNSISFIFPSVNDFDIKSFMLFNLLSAIVLIL
jgi:hypothetical protein